jgi:hypothetical protein
VWKGRWVVWLVGLPIESTCPARSPKLFITLHVYSHTLPPPPPTPTHSHTKQTNKQTNKQPAKQANMQIHTNKQSNKQNKWTKQVEQCVSPAETKTIKIRGVPFAATPEDLSQYFGGLFGEGECVMRVFVGGGGSVGVWRFCGCCEVGGGGRMKQLNYTAN